MHTKALITDVDRNLQIAHSCLDIMLPFYKIMYLYFKYNQETTSNLGKMFRAKL